MANPTQFKIVLVGDGDVGKTTFVKRFLTNEFESKYVATLGVEVHPIHLQTNYGLIIFNMWDCAGVEKYGGLRDGYYVLANGCLVMYDVTNGESMLHASKWKNDVIGVFNNSINKPSHNVEKLGGTFPCVVCGTKGDLINIEGEDIISTKDSKNIYKPLVKLARMLMNKPDLQILEHTIPPVPQHVINSAFWF